MCLAITSYTIFLPYVLQTERKSCCFSKGLNSKIQLAKGKMTHSWHRLSTTTLSSFHNTSLGGENTPARKPRWGKTFSNAVSKAAPGPHGTKCESDRVLWSWGGAPKEHRKCPAPSPLAQKASSKPSLLLLAVGYLPIGRWVYQVAAFSGRSPVSHGMMQPRRGLTPPPRLCKARDSNVSLSQHGY